MYVAVYNDKYVMDLYHAPSSINPTRFWDTLPKAKRALVEYVNKYYEFNTYR